MAFIIIVIIIVIVVIMIIVVILVIVIKFMKGLMLNKYESKLIFQNISQKWPDF
jgi:hypothetical protein